MESKHTLAEYQRSYYLERKWLGVCVKCGRKAVAGMSQCGVCLRKNRERKMVLHPLFCGECKQPIKSEERSGRRLHKLCAQRRQARMSPRTHRSAALAYQKRHKEMGLCTRCPKKTFRANLCRKHYRTTLEKYHRARGEGVA